MEKTAATPPTYLEVFRLVTAEVLAAAHAEGNGQVGGSGSGGGAASGAHAGVRCLVKTQRQSGNPTLASVLCPIYTHT